MCRVTKISNTYTSLMTRNTKKKLTNVTRKIKDFNFNDLINIYALFKHDTLKNGQFDQYIVGGDIGLISEFPTLSKILQETKGIIIYQEQIIEIFHQIGGFSYTEASIVEKVIRRRKQGYQKVKVKYQKQFIKQSILPLRESSGIFKLCCKTHHIIPQKTQAVIFGLMEYVLGLRQK